VFAPHTGPLAVALEGFEPRQGQRSLAQRVAATIADGGVLLAEAGTGIGKTLAYLVPALFSGRRTLISTGTRNLQDQIFYKDVPALARVLGRPIAAAYMKGRTNYLCRHRFDRLEEAATALPESDQRWMREIRDWTRATETGDRAEIDDLPDDLPLWHEITATAEQCLGRECPSYDTCFITAMRTRADASDLIVVNHHLLCADAAVRQGGFGEVIPECDILVLDEAHQIEDVATQYFGVAFGTHRVDQFIRDATAAVAAFPAEAGRAAIAVSQAIDELQRRTRAFFDHLRDEVHRASAGDRVTFTADMAARVDDARANVAGALDAVIAGAEHDAAPADLVGLRDRAAIMRADLDTLTSGDPRYVHFIEVRGRGTSLRAAPIDASAIVRDVVVGARHAVALVSATLTVEGDFAYMQSRLGLEHAQTLTVPSEFDFESQAILYLPPEMPEPRSPEFNRRAADVVAELLGCTEGRAFVLFTSYAAMRDVHRLLADTVEWPLLLQGTAPRASLLRDFRATPNAVLLATSSFWQGVDVVGEALSAVIIDRLPFASPGDPLVAARIRALEASGVHPFHAYQVPLATLTLLQGLGRLIRSRSDRGVLAILDPRLTRMSYGRRFLNSLPPAPITHEMRDIRRFFTSAPV
jgi:ATP-dependent DNA helicase DinG